MAIVSLDGKPISSGPKFPQINPMKFPPGGAGYITEVNRWLNKYEVTPEIFAMIEETLLATPPDMIELILQESYHKRNYIIARDKILEGFEAREAETIPAQV